MSRWVLRIFAVIGFFAVLLVVLVAVCAIYNANNTPAEPKTVILTLDFDQAIVEQESASVFDFAQDDEEKTSLFDITRALDRAAADTHVKGILAHFGSNQPTLAQAQEIRAALARFSKSGKFSYAFGPSYGDFGLGNRAYYLASAFENIWVQPVGSVSLTGIAMQSPFARGALDKVGVTPEFLRREEYKSVMEMATETAFSPPVRENMQSMLNDLADQIAGGIAESRKWDAAHVKQLMEKGPYTADEALKAGLVTRIGYADELDTELKQKAGSDAARLNVNDYLATLRPTSADKSKPRTHVALIYGTGLITDRAVGTDITGEGIMGADQVAKAFDDAAASKNVKAIIFRIDSPGGSPQASETIRRALIHAQKAGKPVFVSMGAVAASGGYWVAMSADRIIADPGTLTGSIGVVAGKFVLAGLMQKIGVNWDTLATPGNAAMWSGAQNFTPQQRERVNALLDDTYHTFTQDVAEGRKLPVDDMPSLAKGRVYTGAQAAKNGLVDELGGYDVTLAAVRKKLNLTADDGVSLDQFPPPETPAEKLMGLFKKFGTEGAMVGQTLSGLHDVQARLGPMLRDALTQEPVTAQVPASVLQLVR